MKNCEKCGSELKEGAAFCSHCGAPAPPLITAAVVTQSQKIIDLAGWGDRILAYIIDIIILGVFIGIIRGFFSLPSILGGAIPYWVPWSNFPLDNIVYLAYFWYMDLTYGQSLGKMVMRIKMTNLEGGSITAEQSAIEALGKAFLLPLDVILGWIFTTSKNQRIFTYLARTIVIKYRHD